MSLDQLLIMSQAHLQNVHNTVEDLQKQKNNIDQEIARLTEYLQAGIKTVQEFNNTSKVDQTQEIDNINEGE
jgi:hypothetical protein